MKAKATAALLASLSAAAQVETARAQAQPWPMHDTWYWWMPFHGLIWLLMVAAIVVGVVVLIRYLWHGAGHPGPGQGPGRSRALEHLDERYARGEIDRDEYLQRRRDLAGH